MTQTPLTDELVKELYEDAAKRKKAPVPVRDPFDRAIELCYELERQLAERDRQLAEAQRERDAEREERRSRFSLDDLNVDVPCETCGGLGKRLYGSTSTWRHGIGGQAMTADVCDTCWGSGDKNKTWPSHKKAYSATERAEKAEAELAALRSAELPVEPEPLGIPYTQDELLRDRQRWIDYGRALKAFALKEKERADGLQKIQDEAESILFSVGDITCANGHKHKRHDGCLYCLAEAAESELAALRGRLMDLDAKDWLDTLADADKAMSAVALKEGK